MKRLSQDQISTITTLLNEGKREAEIAKILNCARSTVAKYRITHSNGTIEPVRGRPRKLSPRDKRALARLVANGGTKSAQEASKTLNLERDDKVSPMTVRRALREQGLRAIKKVKKPRLSKSQRAARLKWALEHENWTLDDWKRVIWSDETKINRLNSDGIKYAWSKNPKNYPPEMVEETLKFGGGSLMIWGCMTWFGTGGMSRIVGRMDSEQLISILSTSLIPTIDEVVNKLPLSARDEALFQQDNDPKHTSRSTKNFLARENIKTMKWPSQSPDLNPIEHLWGMVKCRLGEYPEPPSSIHELGERVEEVWHRIGVDLCRKLIESMESRVQAVKDAKGGHTRY